MECPHCKSKEEHPTDKNKILIKGYKVFDKTGIWSQCLVCSGYYDSKTLKVTKENHDNHKGWFLETKED